MPTSTTTAPSRTQSPGIRPGLPAATISTSALRTCDSRSRVKRCVTVVVAPISSSSSDIGRPTMFEAPTTTQCLPFTDTPMWSSIRTTP